MARACLLALSRDDAKRLFAQKSDEALQALLREMLSASENRAEPSTCLLDASWTRLEEAFAKAAAASADLAPLRDCLLGGRSLHEGSEWIVSLKRPDMSPHIFTALQRFGREGLERTVGGSEEAARGFDQVLKLYENAAANRQAALFVVAH